ncbi:electron transfer flavoprotein subunit alpha/FixB family protein [Dubosiella newyorkensis]|uniref:Electron transfer flavoprotein subunit alpha n=2 Tax=Dubosiella newyorkensis TaxID=1862672 RepID=A0A1U7NME2_9FIRM|nr:electron transfer flavoprotein subunit alpha/FixB family protein [Dubosiella newyorkensis]OLU46366.1 electron transfer flavoprotein subunit alpha [Dubosiella newyorkensis]
MAKLVLHPENIDDPQVLIDLCPFKAMEMTADGLNINAGCKMCKLCVRKGPKGAVEFVEDQVQPQIDKSVWNGICVYVDQVDGAIHPVTFELLGKAKDMAHVIDQPVQALLIGSNVSDLAHELLHYGADEVYVYDDERLDRFKIDAYTNVFEDFIQKHKPSSILVGATTIGRQLAPRVAARMKTGLTADCTILEMEDNSDLNQIRPAFGGNIMAHIKTPNHRPQMATVRYKIMNAPERKDEEEGIIIDCASTNSMVDSQIEVLDILKKEAEESIESADVLVVAGRGVKNESDLEMLQKLADLLHGKLACTRPLVENGFMSAKQQIGLSGRTVRPKLIITCGVSGAIQFTAGMDHSDQIVAIDMDPDAPIFKNANYGLVGDLYEIVPSLIEKIEAKKGVQNA